MSLLPLAGMFIFGKKEKKKTMAEIIKELSEKYELPEEIIRAIGNAHLASDGYLLFLKSIDPESNLDRVMKASGAKKGSRTAATTVEDHEYRKYIVRNRDPKSRGYHILHGVLAVLLANHIGKASEEIGWAIGDAIYEYLVNKGKTIEDIQRNPDEFAKTVVEKLKSHEVINDAMARSTKKAIIDVLPPTMKLIDKMWPKDHNPKHLNAIGDAFSSDVQDPIRVLKTAGIDVTKEVEEVRNTIAEITGKKPKEVRKKSSTLRSKKTKSNSKKKEPTAEKVNLPSDALLEVLSIFQALEFSDYSEKAKEKAIQRLSSAIEDLLKGKPTPENLLKLGLYSYAAELIRRGEFEKVEELKKLQS